MLGAGPALAEGTAYDWSTPTVFEYRDAFGQLESYIVVSYRVENGERAVRVPDRPLDLRTSDGRSLNDGFRPFVHEAYCNRRGCDRRSLSTVRIAGQIVPPGSRVRGLALFHVPGAWPRDFVLSGGEREGVAYAFDPTEREYVPFNAGRERASKVSALSSPPVADRLSSR